MVQTIKRVVMVGIAVLVLATWALSAYAASSPRVPGPVGARWIPEAGRALYCDNFYDGPPMATTPSGAPLPEIHKQREHWCYVETKGYWVPTNPSYYG